MPSRPAAAPASSRPAYATAGPPTFLTSRTVVITWAGIATALAFLGVLVGQGLAVGIIAFLPLVALSAWACRRLDRDERLDLVTVFFLALGVRWLVSTLIQLLIYNTRPGLFGPDELMYDSVARYISEALSGHMPMPPEAQSLAGLVWLNGVIYYLLGYGVLAAKLFVGLGGAWTAVLAGLIGKQLHDEAVGRRAAFVAAVTPSLITWACINTKDASTLLGGELGVLAFMLMRSKFRFSYLVVFALSLLYVAAYRPYEIVFINDGTAPPTAPCRKISISAPASRVSEGSER